MAETDGARREGSLIISVVDAVLARHGGADAGVVVARVLAGDGVVVPGEEGAVEDGDPRGGGRGG